MANPDYRYQSQAHALAEQRRAQAFAQQRQFQAEVRRRQLEAEYQRRRLEAEARRRQFEAEARERHAQAEARRRVQAQGLDYAAPGRGEYYPQNQVQPQGPHPPPQERRQLRVRFSRLLRIRTYDNRR